MGIVVPEPLVGNHWSWNPPASRSVLAPLSYVHSNLQQSMPVTIALMDDKGVEDF